MVEVLEGMVKINDVYGVGKMEFDDGFVVVGAVGKEYDFGVAV